MAAKCARIANKLVGTFLLHDGRLCVHPIFPFIQVHFSSFLFSLVCLFRFLLSSCAPFLPNFLIFSFNFFPASSIVGSKVRLKCGIFFKEKNGCPSALHFGFTFCFRSVVSFQVSPAFFCAFVGSCGVNCFKVIVCICGTNHFIPSCSYFVRTFPAIIFSREDLV